MDDISEISIAIETKRPEFQPYEQRVGTSFQRHIPPREFHTTDIPNTNAQQYYFSPEQMLVPEVNRAARYSVFHLAPAVERGYLYATGGTCFLVNIDSKAYLITQAHCLEDLGPVSERKIEFYRGQGNKPEEISLAEAKVIYMPEKYRPGKDDIAIMDVSEVKDFYRFGELSLSDGLAPGDPIFSIGYPIEAEGDQKIAVGRVRNIEADGTFRYDCLSVSGQSGGPILSREGQVIGMVWMAEPEDYVQGHAQIAMIGITASRIREFIAKGLQTQVAHGAS